MDWENGYGRVNREALRRMYGVDGIKSLYLDVLDSVRVKRSEKEFLAW